MTNLTVATPEASSRNEPPFDAIQAMVADCVGLAPNEVLPESRFFEDLGGESIDLLDLSFQFERAFQIRVPFKAILNASLWEHDEAGELTPAARAGLAQEFPGLEMERRIAQARSINPRDLLTIDLMHQMLVHAKPI